MPLTNRQELTGFPAEMIEDIAALADLAERTDPVIANQLRVHLRLRAMQTNILFAMVQRDLGTIYIEQREGGPHLVLECHNGLRNRCCRDCKKQ